MSEDQVHLEPHGNSFRIAPLDNAIQQAIDLDAEWFKEDGVSKEKLKEFLQLHPQGGIALFEGDTFRGFATFEIVESGKLPQDYSGTVPQEGKYLFIQQFTTDQNYSGDMSSDRLLLAEVEKIARAEGCAYVAEALDRNHAFNPERSLAERGDLHNAFGFYEERGYQRHGDLRWTWQAENYSPVGCVLYTKSVPLAA